MNKVLLFTVALGGAFWGATAVSGQEEAPTVPSGLSLNFQEWLLIEQPDGQIFSHFRFVAPALGQVDGPRHGDIETDFQHLCDSYAAQTLVAQSTHVDQIVISFADRELEFGETAPQAVQYFEAFRLQDGVCIWEVF